MVLSTCGAQKMDFDFTLCDAEVLRNWMSNLANYCMGYSGALEKIARPSVLWQVLTTGILKMTPFLIKKNRVSNFSSASLFLVK